MCAACICRATPSCRSTPSYNHSPSCRFVVQTKEKKKRVNECPIVVGESFKEKKKMYTERSNKNKCTLKKKQCRIDSGTDPQRDKKRRRNYCKFPS